VLPPAAIHTAVAARLAEATYLLSAFEAAAAGVYLHGLAGKLARAALGAAGVVAGDVTTQTGD